MKTLLIRLMAVLALGTSVVAIPALANAQTTCFQGDTMDRDGGHSGALGAPSCNYQPRAFSSYVQG
jgi:hypothetical protein